MKKRWTIEKIKDVAKNYSTMPDFKKKEGSAYAAAVRQGKYRELRDIFPLINKLWSYSDLQESAAKYNTIRDWRKNESAAYSTAKARKLIQKLTKHMLPLTRKPWTKNEIMEIAKKFDHKVDFINANNSAYNIAIRKGWLDEVCAHMEPIGNKHLRLLYSIEIKKQKKIYFGLTQNLKNRLSEHLKSERFRELKLDDLIIKKITSYIPQNEAIKKEKSLIKIFSNKGYILLNKSKGGELGTSQKYWSEKKILEIAKRFKTPKEWKEKNPRSYSASLKSLNHKLATSHMEKSKRKKKWTLTNILKSARKFKFKQEWRNNDGGACAEAIRLGIYKKATKHMRRPKKAEKWTKENIIKSALKYKKISYWINDFPGAYQAAKRKSILKKVKNHMVDGRIKKEL